MTNPLGVIPELLSIRVGNEKYQQLLDEYLLSLLHRLPENSLVLAGRDSLLVAMKQAGVGVQVLSGMHGVGKSSLATYHAAAKQSDFIFARAIAAHSAQLHNEFVGIASLLQLEIGKATDAIALVFAYLLKKQGWLLILDGVEQFEVVATFLPRPQQLKTNQQIIITTTNSRWLEPWHHIVLVDSLAETDAILLIRRLLPSATDKQAAELAKKLAGHPLSIMQVCRYLQATGLPLGRYLTSNLAASHDDLFKQHLTAVVEDLEQTNPTAYRFLVLCCLLDCSNIPLQLFEQEELLQSAECVDSAYSTLQNFSLIKMDAEGKCVSMHPYSQQLLKTILLEKITPPVLITKFILPLHAAFKKLMPFFNKDLASYLLGHKLLPHAQAFILVAESLDGVKSQLWSVIFDISIAVAYRHSNLTNYSLAKQIVTKCLSAQPEEQAFDYASLVEFLGFLHLKLNEYAEARTRFNQAQELFQSLNVPKSIITVMLNQSLIYAETGEFYQRQLLLVEVEKLLATRSGDSSNNDLCYLKQYQANTSYEMGSYHATLVFVAEAMRLVQMIQGSYCPEVAMLYLVRVMASLNETESWVDFKKIKTDLKQAQEILELTLPEQHTDFAELYNAWSCYFMAKQDYSQAKNYASRAIELVKAQSSSSKDQSLRLGITYANALLCVDDEAVEPCLKELKKYKTDLPHHLYWGSFYFLQAAALLKAARKLEAHKKLNKAMQVYQAAHAEQHPQYLEIESIIANKNIPATSKRRPYGALFNLLVQPERVETVPASACCVVQ